jgi:hypothetical protein
MIEIRFGGVVYPIIRLRSKNLTWIGRLFSTEIKKP